MFNLHHPNGLTAQLNSPYMSSLSDLEYRIQRFNEDMAYTGSKLRAGYRTRSGWHTIYFELQDGNKQLWCEQYKYATRSPAESLVRFDSEALRAIMQTMGRGYLYALADGTHADPSVKFTFGRD